MLQRWGEMVRWGRSPICGMLGNVSGSGRSDGKGYMNVGGDALTVDFLVVVIGYNLKLTIQH